VTAAASTRRWWSEVAAARENSTAEVARDWLWTWSRVSTDVDAADGAGSVLSGFVDACQLPRIRDRLCSSASVRAIEAAGKELAPRDSGSQILAATSPGSLVPTAFNAVGSGHQGQRSECADESSRGALRPAAPCHTLEERCRLWALPGKSLVVESDYLDHSYLRQPSYGKVELVLTGRLA
jgi:hypothetical protein